MSFILDALRKSESERQRDAAPSLSRIPEAVAVRKLPAWAAGTIALLGLGVVGLAAALWLSARGTGEGPAAARNSPETVSSVPAASGPSGADGALDAEANRSPEPTATRSLEPVASRAVETTARGSLEPSARRSLEPSARRSLEPSASSAIEPSGRPAVEPSASPAVEPSANRAVEPDKSRAHGDDGIAEPRPNADTTRAARTVESKPLDGSPSVTDDSATALPLRYETAAATDASLPKLTLEFHAFAADPARRFVYIDGEKYVEGSRLPQGLRIVRITADGVVIEAAGRELLLPRK